MSDDMGKEVPVAPAEEKQQEVAVAPAEEKLQEAAGKKPRAAAKTPEEKRARRKRIWKRVGIVAGVIFLLLATALIFRDFLIEQGVRRVGTWLLGTPVNIESFSSSFAGTVEIKGLTVGNPEGYHAPHIFSLRRVFVSLKPLSVLTDKIIVEEVTVEGMRVDFESKITETNLGVIQDNVNKKLASLGASGDTPKEPDSDDKEEKPQQQLVIRKLEVRDYSASISAKVLSTSLVLPLVPVSLTDVGEGQPIGETVSGLFGAIGSSISSAAAKSGGVLGGLLKDTGDFFGDAAHNTGSALKDAGSKLKKMIDK